MIIGEFYCLLINGDYINGVLFNGDAAKPLNDVTYYSFLGGGHSFRSVGRTFRVRDYC